MPVSVVTSTGRVIVGLCALFLIFDATLHVMNVPAVVQAFANLGFPDADAFELGLVEYVAIALLLFPRTTPIGALLITAYLGGATAAQIRIGGPAWFSILVGLLLWIGLYVADPRTKQFIRHEKTA